MGWKNEVSLTDKFHGLAGEYHQYVFKYERNKKIPATVWVIQQDKNRKLKKQNCNQQTSLIQAILESLFYCFQTQKPCSVRDVSKTGFIMIKK